MKVLFACEESQTVLVEFMKRGHEAYSCDILPTSGPYPEWHLQQDVTPLLKQKWDRVISFVPCTHLAVSGAKHFAAKRADGRQRSAVVFFLHVWYHSDAVENPVGIMNSPKYLKQWFPDLYQFALKIGFPFKPSQIIQPYQFGDPFTKTTCLWLRNGLPLLTPTNVVDKGERHITKGGKSLPVWYNLPPGEDRARIRSKTFPGIAAAMAQQWG